MRLPRPTLLLLLLAAPAAWGGLFGNDAPGRIPVPAQEFRMRIEDRSGVVVDVERASFDGEIYLFGTVGLAQVTVPFDTLRRLDVAPGADEDHVVGRILTRLGETQEVVLESDRPLFGRTTFGNYRIEIGQVRSLEPR